MARPDALLAARTVGKTREQQFRDNVLKRVLDAGGLPLPSRNWPGTMLVVTLWERGTIRQLITDGLLPKVPIFEARADDLLTGDNDPVLERLTPAQPKELPYEETPALLAMRARKRALGR